jgi:hypothetical protein
MTEHDPAEHPSEAGQTEAGRPAEGEVTPSETEELANAPQANVDPDAPVVMPGSEPSAGTMESPEDVVYQEGDIPPPSAAGAATVGYDAPPVVMPEDGPFGTEDEEAHDDEASHKE